MIYQQQAPPEIINNNKKEKLALINIMSSSCHTERYRAEDYTTAPHTRHFQGRTRGPRFCFVLFMNHPEVSHLLGRRDGGAWVSQHHGLTHLSIRWLCDASVLCVITQPCGAVLLRFALCELPKGNRKGRYGATSVWKRENISYSINAANLVAV